VISPSRSIKRKVCVSIFWLIPATNLLNRGICGRDAGTERNARESARRQIAALEAGKLEVRPGLSNVLKDHEPRSPAVHAEPDGEYVKAQKVDVGIAMSWIAAIQVITLSRSTPSHVS
jgi:hypothetical protein